MFCPNSEPAGLLVETASVLVRLDFSTFGHVMKLLLDPACVSEFDAEVDGSELVHAMAEKARDHLFEVAKELVMGKRGGD